MRWQNSRGAIRAIRRMDAPTTRLNSRRHAAKQRKRHPNTVSSGTKNGCSGRIADRSKRCDRKTVFHRGNRGNQRRSAYNCIVFEAEGNSSRKQEENPENAIATVPDCPACLFAFFFGLFSPDRGAWFRSG